MATGAKAGGRRGRLTRERILLAALEFADSHGIEALKMRELGHTLGFEAMALYRHVAGKDAILEGILDLVLEEVEPPPAAGNWAKAIRSGAVSAHAALERHPWATKLMVSPTGLRPGRLEFAEALLARLEDAGFSDDACYHAYHVLDAHIIGFSLWQAGHVFTSEERAAIAERLEHISFDPYPLFARHRDQHLAEGAHRDVSAFEVGLDLILAGLKKMRAAERAALRASAGSPKRR
jgi:AcrR family transcriptional regulator